MVAATLADIYATALLDLAEETDGRDAVVADAVEILDLLVAHPEIVTTVVDPRRNRQEAERLLTDLFADRIHPHLRDLLYVLVQRGRFGEVEDILRQVLVLDGDRRGVLPVRVTTAIELDPLTRGEVTAGVRRRLGAGAECSFDVDPRIVGGLVLRYRDRRVDLSVRQRAEEMTQRLRRVPLVVAWDDADEKEQG